MSQRNPAPGPPSNAPRQQSQSLPPASPSLPRPQSARNVPSETLPPEATAGPTLPPVESVTSAVRPSPRSSSTFQPEPRGMQSILNPSHHVADDRRQFELLSLSGQRVPPGPALAMPILPQIAKRSAQEMAAADELLAPSSRMERRGLTSRSPTVRAPSSGAHQSFALSPWPHAQTPSMPHDGRPCPAEPGQDRISDFQPSSVPTPFRRSSNPYPSMVEPAPGQPSRRSSGRNVLAASGIQAQGESPSTSNSSFSHFSQSSPILRYGGPPYSRAALQAGSARPSISLPIGQQSSAGLSEGQYDLSRGSYGISIPTQEGQMLLPVEVDVEQASKAANDKRKRNAGASARFRQRRKEKEREASQTISSLEDNVRAAEDERNHYRAERDFFRDLLARHIGPGQLPQRPPTPHPPISSRPPRLDAPSWQELPRESSEPPPRNVRRRTGSFPPLGAAPSAVSPVLPPQTQQAYAPGPPAPVPTSRNPFPSPGPPSAAPSFLNQPPLPPPQIPSPMDPFRRNLYSRSWNPGP